MDETATLESLTGAGTLMGTPHYLSPEILQGKPADVRSDIWAMGVVLYQMLIGGLPFQGLLRNRSNAHSDWNPEAPM